MEKKIIGMILSVERVDLKHLKLRSKSLLQSIMVNIY